MTRRRLLWIIGGATLVRAIVAASFPLIPDETYYWLWAQHLDWSYLDQPPIIAYLLFLTTQLGDSALWVRLSPLVFGAATSYALFLLGRDLFDEGVGLRAAVLFQVVPILWLAGLLATPDAPLYLAWTLALRFLWQAVHGRPGRWLAAGSAVGFGLLSKPYMAFLVVGAAIFVAIYHRLWLRKKEPYVASMLAVILFLPVIYWNLQHDWAAIRFILYERPTRAPHGVAGIRLLLSQYVEAVLVFVVAFPWAVWVAWKRRMDERYAYLFWTSLPALVFPLLAAPGGAAFGHWVGPAHLALAIALATRWNRGVAVLTGVAAAVVALSVALVFIPGLPPPPGGAHAYGWGEAMVRARQEAATLGGQAVLVTDSDQIAAELTYLARGTVPVLLLPNPDPASVWPHLGQFTGAPAVAVTYLHSTMNWNRCARSVEAAAPIVVHFRGWPLAEYRVFRLRGLFSQCM